MKRSVTLHSYHGLSLVSHRISIVCQRYHQNGVSCLEHNLCSKGTSQRGGRLNEQGLKNVQTRVLQPTRDWCQTEYCGWMFRLHQNGLFRLEGNTHVLTRHQVRWMDTSKCIPHLYHCVCSFQNWEYEFVLIRRAHTWPVSAHFSGRIKKSTLLLYFTSFAVQLRWLNKVLWAVSGNSRDGACFKLDKQTWWRKKQWYTEGDFSKSTH